MRHVKNLIDERVSTIFCVVIKKLAALNPLPSIRVLTNSGHFALKKLDILLILPPSSIDYFNMMKDTNNLPWTTI